MLLCLCSTIYKQVRIADPLNRCSYDAFVLITNASVHKGNARLNLCQKHCPQIDSGYTMPVKHLSRTRFTLWKMLYGKTVPTKPTTARQLLEDLSNCRFDRQLVSFIGRTRQHYKRCQSVLLKSISEAKKQSSMFFREL